VITIVALGVIGFYMKKYDYSIIAFVLGVVLGGIAEENLFRSLILTEGTIPIFFTKPLSLAIVVVIVLILATPILQPWLESRRS